MKKARIEDTDEIVHADQILENYSNYHSLIFVCIDKNCSVRMAPVSITKNDKRKPHFKKYPNHNHIEDCEYATYSKIILKGKDEKLTYKEIRKVGYPSVFMINENFDAEIIPIKKTVSFNNGVTYGFNKNTELYQFEDGDDLKFNRKNKVQSIDRIVNWYIGFPYNRDVEIEIENKKIEYRHFFKRIDKNPNPNELLEKKIYFGKIILSKTNIGVFDKYEKYVYITFLGHDPKVVDNKIKNYSIKIDKSKLSKYMVSKLKNSYDSLMEIAYKDRIEKKQKQNFGLYIFAYGTLEEKNNTTINVIKHHITFRYDEIRETKTEFEKDAH